MSSLLADFAGQVKLVYIDPPFDTGTDFSHRVSIGDSSVTKVPSILEEHAYRDRWGLGRDVPDDAVSAVGTHSRTARGRFVRSFFRRDGPAAEPCVLHIPEGFQHLDAGEALFATDAAFFAPIAEHVMLFGPGSIE